MNTHPFLTSAAVSESAPGAQRQSDSQTMATFGAASGDNCAATAGFHANQEAMSALATNYGRLICAFHDN